MVCVHRNCHLRLMVVSISYIIWVSCRSAFKRCTRLLMIMLIEYSLGNFTLYTTVVECIAWVCILVYTCTNYDIWADCSILVHINFKIASMHASWIEKQYYGHPPISNASCPSSSFAWGLWKCGSRTTGRDGREGEWEGKSDEGERRGRGKDGTEEAGKRMTERRRGEGELEVGGGGRKVELWLSLQESYLWLATQTSERFLVLCDYVMVDRTSQVAWTQRMIMEQSLFVVGHAINQWKPTESVRFVDVL